MTLTRPLSCVSALCCRFTSPKTKTGHRTAATERSQRQWEEQRVRECACHMFIKWQIFIPLRLMLRSVFISHYLLLSSPYSLSSFMTPLHVAAERAYNDIMEVLQKHGAKVHTCMCSLVPTELRYTSSHSIVYLKGIVYWKKSTLFLHIGNLYSGRKGFFFLLPFNNSSSQREGGNWLVKNRLWLVLVQALLTDIISQCFSQHCTFCVSLIKHTWFNSWAH